MSKEKDEIMKKYRCSACGEAENCSMHCIIEAELPPKYCPISGDETEFEVLVEIAKPCPDCQKDDCVYLETCKKAINHHIDVRKEQQRRIAELEAENQQLRDHHCGVNCKALAILQAKIKRLKKKNQRFRAEKLKEKK